MTQPLALPSALRTLLLLAPLGAAAFAQVETPASPGSCGAPSYVLQVGSDRERTPLTVKLNGKSIDLGKPYQSASRNVTAAITDQNRIQLDWTPKKLSDSGLMYGVPVTLKVLYGSRATTLFQFDPEDYPNQRQVAVKFAALPRAFTRIDAGLSEARAHSGTTRGNSNAEQNKASILSDALKEIWLATRTCTRRSWPSARLSGHSSGRLPWTESITSMCWATPRSTCVRS